jgi:hypothetical protein
MAEDLGENPQGLQLPIEHLVMCARHPLHCTIFCRIRAIPGALYFVGVAAVALASLNPLSRPEEVSQNLVKILCQYTYRQGMDPESMQVPCKDVYAQLVVRGGFPCILVGRNGVPLCL